MKTISLTMSIDGTREYILEVKTKSKFIDDRIKLPDCPQERLMLRPKQSWLIQSTTGWFIVEFLGMINMTRMTVRKWVVRGNERVPHLTRAHIYRNYYLYVAEESSSMGAGSSCFYEYDDLFQSVAANRVIMSGDIVNTVRGVRSLERQIINIIPDRRPRMPEKIVVNDDLLEKVKLDLGCDIDKEWLIFPDGSWLENGGKIESVFYPEKKDVICAGGLVFIQKTETWKSDKVLCYKIHDCARYDIASAYPIELTCLTLALLIVEKLGLKASIFTDCSAAMKALSNQDKVRKWSKKTNYVLLNIGAALFANVHKVKAHPEKVEKDRSKWTVHMWGNHIADISASADPSKFAEEDFLTGQNIYRIGIPMQEVLYSISMSDGLFWGDEEGNPSLKSYEDCVPAVKSIKYLVKRDKFREDRAEPPKWVGRSLRFAARVKEMTRRTRADAARLLRIGFDWFNHGGNKRKHNRREKGLCELCHLPDSQTHWMMECGNVFCVKIRADTDEKICKYLDSIDMNLYSFGRLVRRLGNKGDTGAMVQVGLYGEYEMSILAQEFPRSYTEIERGEMEKVALEIGFIWIEGVLRQYVHKLHKGKVSANEEYYARRRVNREEAIQAAKKKSDKKRKSKIVKTSEQNMLDYNKLLEVRWKKPAGWCGAGDGLVEPRTGVG